MARGWWLSACALMVGCASNPDLSSVLPSAPDESVEDEGAMGEEGSETMAAESDAGDGNLLYMSSGCADDPTTPGIDCPDVLSCGGSMEAPTACPTSTHSCCASGPTEASCYEGTQCGEALIPAGCDGPEDCSDGQVCCVQPHNGFVTGCVDDCQGGFIQCHTDDHCPLGESCLQNQFHEFWANCG